jgi:hypothetical protein
MRICGLIGCLLLAGSANAAGILVFRSDQGLQFAEAVAVFVNGKDKALSLGAQPKISAPISKLSDVRLAGVLLKSAESHTVALYDPAGRIDYLLPQGTPKNTAPDAAAIWQTAKISYKKSTSDKAPAEVTAAQFVAFLPDGIDGLVKLGMDSEALQMAGGQAAAFSFQIELLSATVKAYGSNPAVTAIEKYIEQSMAGNYELFESGAGGVQQLAQGLQFAKLSQATYPDRPEQQRLRNLLSQKKAWLDRRTAVLRALFAGGQWDAFLLGYRDFEKYQWSFPDMTDRHLKALNASLEMHRKVGRQRLAEGDYYRAFREMRLASLRHPSDSGLQKEVAVAWTEYSRQAAVDRQRRRKQLSAGQRDAITQSLHFAGRYKEQNKLDEALKSILEAENIDFESLPVLLRKAEILAARNELSRALATLDEYDQRAVEDERPPASKLRNEVLFQLTINLRDWKNQIEKAWTDYNFYQARKLALEGLRAKEDDPDLMYFAAMSSLVTRQPKESRSHLTRYLEASDTVDANKERRHTAFQLLASIGDGVAVEQGEPNWLSGKKLPKDVYYCPISLAFQPRVRRIAASNKLKVEFVWEGNRMKSIVPVFEKNTDATGEKPILFAYEDRVPQIRLVGYDNLAAGPVPADADEALKRSSLILINNPLVDPLMVQKLKGNNITLGVAGNKFFHPFVWEKLYFFQFTYDTAGRVKTALLLPEPNAATGGDVLVEFEWNGQKLSHLKAFQLMGGDEKKRTLIYERTPHYQENRLMTEEVHSRGKVTHIKYTYNGDQLVSADCEKDESLDGRSRQVTFF